MKKNEMDGVCSTYERRNNSIKLMVDRPEGRACLGDLVVKGVMYPNRCERRRNEGCGVD